MMKSDEQAAYENGTAEESEMTYSCAVCGREIPDEQPDSVRGFCSAKCKALSDKEDAPRTTPEAVEEFLNEAFRESDDIFTNVRSFAEVGMLTTNSGLVVRTADGREFQITITRSR